jgi:hypothetical protein
MVVELNQVGAYTDLVGWMAVVRGHPSLIPTPCWGWVTEWL